MDHMNAAFQDPTKSMSKLIEVSKQTLSVLTSSRTDEHWDLFYKMVLKHTSIIECVQEPTNENVTRRRNRHNCRNIENNFMVDGHSACNDVRNIEATCKKKDARVTISCNSEVVLFPTCGTLQYLNACITCV